MQNNYFLSVLFDSTKISISSSKGISFIIHGDLYSPTDLGLTLSVKGYIEYFEAFDCSTVPSYIDTEYVDISHTIMETCDDYDWFTNTCYSGEKLLKQPLLLFYLANHLVRILGLKL